MASDLPAMFPMANTEVVSHAMGFLYVGIAQFLLLHDYDGCEFRAARHRGEAVIMLVSYEVGLFTHAFGGYEYCAVPRIVRPGCAQN